MGYLRLLLVVMASLLGSWGAAAQEKTITIATEGAFAPWNSKDAAGHLVGFEIDLIPNLCARMQIRCNIVDQAWSGIIPGLNAGKYDAIMAAMSVTDERSKAVLFTAPYAGVGATFATLKSSPLASYQAKLGRINLADLNTAAQQEISSLAAVLKGKTVGVNRSTTNERFANAYLKDKGVEIRSYDNAENTALDLVAGRVDAVVVTKTQIELLRKRSQDVVAFGPLVGGGIMGVGTAAAVRKGDQELADKFSKAIKEAVADGTIAKLSQKWFGFDNSPL